MQLTIEYPKSILESKLFNSLKDPDMRLLVKEAAIKAYKVGEHIVKEGEEGDEFYWLASGKVEIQMSPTSPNASPLTLTTLTAGDVLGEMGLLGFSKRAASAIVKSDVQLYAWKLKKCLDLFLDHPLIGYRVTRNLGHMVGERLIETNRQLRTRSELLDSKLVRDLVSHY